LERVYQFGGKVQEKTGEGILEGKMEQMIYTLGSE